MAALKPLCSGGRADAEVLFSVQNGALTLDEINPWYFRLAVAPALAAQREKRSVTQTEVIQYIHAAQKNVAVTLVEGGGGLMSPLGKNFDSRDLILELKSTPIIVAQNRLGVVNQLLLTLAALPKPVRAKAKIVLMSPPINDAASRSNAMLLAQFFPSEQIIALPYFGKKLAFDELVKSVSLQRHLAKLLANRDELKGS